MKKICFSLLLLVLLFNGCTKQTFNSRINKTFSLQLGFNENDIGLYFEKNTTNKNTLNVHYRSGFYYLSDSQNNKILKITETGSIVLIIYNPVNNPQLVPTLDKKSETTDDQYAFIKLYKDFPLSSPELISVDIDKNIYVVDKNPDYKKTNNDNTISDTMILKFDKKGNFIHRLGSKGPDTAPFDQITSIINDNKENLVIHEKSMDKDTIYKFSPEGQLLARTDILSEDIDPQSKKESKYLIDIIDIKLGYIEDEVYITCQYVKESTENFLISSYETVYEKILRYSLKNKKVNKLILKNTPEYINISQLKLNENTTTLYGDKEEILKPMENLIGINVTGNIYLTKPELPIDLINENRQKIFIYEPIGKLQKTIQLDYPLDIEYISDFFLSPEGKILIYYIKNGEIQFAFIS